MHVYPGFCHYYLTNGSVVGVDGPDGPSMCQNKVVVERWPPIFGQGAKLIRTEDWMRLDG
jgi:hypothetical protein